MEESLEDVDEGCEDQQYSDSSDSNRHESVKLIFAAELYRPGRANTRQLAIGRVTIRLRQASGHLS